MPIAQKIIVNETSLELVSVDSHSLEEGTILWAPLYLHLPKNGKYVPWKRAFDVLSAKDLERVKKPGFLFSPPLEPYISCAVQAGTKIREFLKSKGGRDSPLPPYQIARHVQEELHSIFKFTVDKNPMWVAVFAGSLSAPVDQVKLTEFHEKDAELLEFSLLRAGWAVLMAVSLDYLDLDFLRSLYHHVIDRSMNPGGSSLRSPEEEEIIAMSFEAVSDFSAPETQMVLKQFNEKPSVSQAKFSSITEGELNG